LKGPFYHLKEHVSSSRGAKRFDMMRKGTLPPSPLKPLPPASPQKGGGCQMG